MRDRTPSYFKIETVFLKSTEYRTLSDAAKDVYQLLCGWVLENRKDVVEERDFDGLLAFFKRLAGDRKRTTIEGCLKQFLERRLIVVLSEGTIYIRGLRRMHENNKFKFDPQNDEISNRISVYRDLKNEGKDTSFYFSFDALKTGENDPMATLRLPKGNPRGTLGRPNGDQRETLRHEEEDVSASNNNNLRDESVHKCNTNANNIERICAIPHNIKNVLDDVHLERKKDQPPPGSSTPPDDPPPPPGSSLPKRSLHSHDDNPDRTPQAGKRPWTEGDSELLRKLYHAAEAGDSGITTAMGILQRRWFKLRPWQANEALRHNAQRLCEWCYSAMTEGRNPTGLLVQYLKSKPDFRDVPHIYEAVKKILFEMPEGALKEVFAGGGE